MPIKVQCQCGKRFAAKDQLAGKRVRCPSCGNPLQIPRPAVDSEAPLKLQPLDDELEMASSSMATTLSPRKKPQQKSKRTGPGFAVRPSPHHWALLEVWMGGSIAFFIYITGLMFVILPFIAAFIGWNVMGDVAKQLKWEKSVEWVVPIAAALGTFVVSYFAHTWLGPPDELMRRKYNVN